MTPAERDRNFRRARAELLKARTQIQRAARAQVVRLLDDALAHIRSVLAQAPSDFKQWSLSQIERQIRQILSEFEQAGGVVLRAAARQSWEAGGEFAVAPIEAGGLRISALLPQIDPRQLNAISAFMVSRIADIGAAAAARISQELGLVVIGAQSPSDAIGKIADLLGDRTRATTIVRTEVGRVFSVAAHERMQQAAEIVPGLKRQWRRSGKIHSRLEHDAIDGQIRDVDEPFTLGNGVQIMFPRDPAAPPGETINCGCEALPFMASWDVSTPGRKPFSEREQALDPRKHELAAAGFDRAA